MAYRKFARLYDIFMSEIPYDEWAELCINKLREYGAGPTVKGSLHDRKTNILELGCGTGNMSAYLCMEGYQVTGTDISEEMIVQARKKQIPDLDLYVADMRLPFFNGTKFDCVVSLCDSMNYLADRSDMELTFRAVHSELAKGGIFLFDLKTDSFYKNELGDNIFADNRKGCSYIWENHYDSERHINIYNITFYYKIIRGLYGRFTEHHVQRAYSRKYIKMLAVKHGFEVLEIIGHQERDYFLLKKL